MPRGNQQVAALPWRHGPNGVEILLVTTRTTKRWAIPKGWIMDGRADHEAAEIEAYEEAGVQGVTEILPLGSYGYLKVLKSGKLRRVTAQVFAMEVDDILEDWPERTERQRQWVSPKKALALLHEVELLPVIADFAKRQGVDVTVEPTKTGLFAMLKKWLRQLLARGN
jgi:8-oxo-dGTP pyrophosphatase MutT (NUDIX family)